MKMSPRLRSAALVATLLLACACRIQGVVLIPVLVAATIWKKRGVTFASNAPSARGVPDFVTRHAFSGIAELQALLAADGVLRSLRTFNATESCLRFFNLQPGTYQIITYAWLPADAAKFQAEAARYGAQFDSYSVAPGVNVKGAQTMGENIADQIGRAHV